MRRYWTEEEWDTFREAVLDLGATKACAEYLLEAFPRHQPEKMLNAARELIPEISPTDEFAALLRAANTPFIHKYYDGKKVINGESWIGISRVREAIRAQMTVTQLARWRMWPLPYARALSEILRERFNIEPSTIDGCVLYEQKAVYDAFGLREKHSVTRSESPAKAKVEATVEPKVEPKVEATVETKVEAKVEATVETKVKPKAKAEAGLQERFTKKRQALADSQEYWASVLQDLNERRAVAIEELDQATKLLAEFDQKAESLLALLG
jgi:hypothetical protein